MHFINSITFFPISSITLMQYVNYAQNSWFDQSILFVTAVIHGEYVCDVCMGKIVHETVRINGNVTNDAFIRPKWKNIKWYVIKTTWLLHTLIFKSFSHQTFLRWQLNFIFFFGQTCRYIQYVLFKFFYNTTANDNNIFGVARHITHEISKERRKCVPFENYEHLQLQNLMFNVSPQMSVNSFSNS